jgi:hypothetical protein
VADLADLAALRRAHARPRQARTRFTGERGREIGAADRSAAPTGPPNYGGAHPLPGVVVGRMPITASSAPRQVGEQHHAERIDTPLHLRPIPLSVPSTNVVRSTSWPIRCHASLSGHISRVAWPGRQR